jgi:predicted small metal-binding protein
MASSSSHGSSFMGDSFSFSSSGDDEILEPLFVHMDRQRQCVFACAIVVFNLFHMFNANELVEGVG